LDPFVFLAVVWLFVLPFIPGGCFCLSSFDMLSSPFSLIQDHGVVAVDQEGAAAAAAADGDGVTNGGNCSRLPLSHDGCNRYSTYTILPPPPLFFEFVYMVRTMDVFTLAHLKVKHLTNWLIGTLVILFSSPSHD
jgi:hypothetical protein